MTLSQKLNTLSSTYTGITGLSSSSFHYWRPQMDAPYLVWAEDGGDGLTAGNHIAEQSITGTTDFFTKTENDPLIDSIQSAQNAVEGLWWALNSVQYEEETGLIHFEWRWRFVG